MDLFDAARFCDPGLWGSITTDARTVLLAAMIQAETQEGLSDEKLEEFATAVVDKYYMRVGSLREASDGGFFHSYAEEYSFHAL